MSCEKSQEIRPEPHEQIKSEFRFLYGSVMYGITGDSRTCTQEKIHGEINLVKNIPVFYS